MPTSGFCGMCLNLMTSCNHTVSFFNVLCVVSALNSQAIQRKACYVVFSLQNQSLGVCNFSGSRIEIIFTDSKMNVL